MGAIERIKCGNGNAYIVSDGDDAILVDTCREEYRDLVLDRCRKKRVRLIILTHGHIDHVQNAAFLSRELDAPIAMHKADYELTKNNWSEPMSAHSLLGKIILRLSQKSFERDKIEPFEPGSFLSEGDSLAGYGVPASIVELPGHTKGSIGIVVGGAGLIGGGAGLIGGSGAGLIGGSDAGLIGGSDAGLIVGSDAGLISCGGADLIVGDALMNMPFPTKSPLYGNRAVMEESAAKISSFGDSMVHFGHGKPARNRIW